jgi:predicted nucleic acid-binding protein
MNKFICLDSNILIKILTWEDDSEKAISLFNDIIENSQTILVPNFAWAEVGTVLRKKVKFNGISLKDADDLWQSFLDLGMIQYVENTKLMDVAWNISKQENFPTLYDAAYLAVSIVYSSDEDICEFWTADQKLINSAAVSKKYIRKLEEQSVERYATDLHEPTEKYCKTGRNVLD